MLNAHNSGHASSKLNTPHLHTKGLTGSHTQSKAHTGERTHVNSTVCRAMTSGERTLVQR